MQWFYGILKVTLTLLGLLAATFLIGRVVPLDPVIALVGDKASHELYTATYKQLGLDLPLYQQFWIYLKHIFQGDWGTSFLSNQHVLDDIKHVFPATLELATFALCIGVGFGIPLGLLSALYQNSWIDQTVRFIALFGNSVSVFWLGLMGLLIFYAELEWLPGPGRLDIYFDYTPITGLLLVDSLLEQNWELFRNAFSHLVLPAGILGFFKMGYISRMTRTFMLEQLSQEYITTAMVKGLSKSRIIWRHALPNVAIPLITVLALSYGTLLEGSTFIETIFLWPGLGFYLSQALMNNDMNAILGATLIIGVIFIGVNMLADLLYRWVDPRAN